jgi:hypothetical protein
VSHELAAVKTFRGSPFATELDASFQTAHTYLRVADSSLASIQWDAFEAQRTIWQGNPAAEPDGLSLSIFTAGQFYDGPMGAGGKPIAVADVSTTTGRRVNWSQLTPAQTWLTYHDKRYDLQGI